ncbi:RNase R-related protein [hydrothermal vent metagenome]|uniref:RNase R-related protein n=1 Tax=hydrothermal vent metagenome TaxID=652676 RepID=A0A3B1AVQ2_9ZZZZ
MCIQGHQLTEGSLVLHKIRPARVLSVAEKIEIEFEGAKSKRVRPKDVVLLHPGPLSDLAELQPCEGEIEEAWELLAGSSTNLPELAELAYGKFVPATAWAAWQLVADGLYFEGQPHDICARTEEQVAIDRTSRWDKAATQQDWTAFLERLNSKAILPDDHQRLTEVERLALKQTTHSRILQTLGQKETPESAHRLLVSLGYWEQNFNPYPQRFEQPLTALNLQVPELPDEERLDLTHLPAFAIDDAGIQDPDDAISLDGDRLWVHIADVAALIVSDGPMDLAARTRAANLYLPEGVTHMLPQAVTEQLGMGLADTSPALSIGIRLDAEAGVVDVEVVKSRVQVTRLSYGEADDILHEPILAAIQEMTCCYRQQCITAGATKIDLPAVKVQLHGGEVHIQPQPHSASRNLVADAMLMAGDATARFARERSIPIPYATQAAPKNSAMQEGMAAMYAFCKSLQSSKTTCKPGVHAGLGLKQYCRVTSPLRRYADLVVHQQLHAFLTGQQPMSKKTVTQHIVAAEAVASRVRKTERCSNTHWKLIYLNNHPKWQGKGTVVEMQDRRATIIIPELAMETRIRLPDAVPLDTQLLLAVREIDLFDQVAWFNILS